MAGVLAFIVGISIAAVSVVPLLLYLNQSSWELARAIAVLRDHQSAKSAESLEVVREGESYKLRNAGPLPLTIVLAAVNESGDCGSVVLRRTSINMSAGNSSDLSGLNLDNVCYVATARGNVFPVKEMKKSQQAPSPTASPFTPKNTLFAGEVDLSKIRIEGNYSTDGKGCDKQGTAAIVQQLGSYEGKVLTINDDSGKIVTFDKKEGGNQGGDKKEGCFMLKFKELVNISGSPYTVVLHYRIVIYFSEKGQKLALVVGASIANQTFNISSTSTETSWTPSSLIRNYEVLEGYLLMRASNLSSGRYDLILKVLLGLQGNTVVNVGVEYVAVQGASLVVG